MRYLLCLLAGVVLGTAATVTASSIGPRIVGDSGYVQGFDVTVRRERVCRDPWIWIDPGGKTGTIECK